MNATFGELDNDLEISSEDFELLFAEFDRDSSGAISKREMADFIKQVAGLGKGAKRN